MTRVFLTGCATAALAICAWSQSPYLWSRTVSGRPQAVVFSSDGSSIFVGSTDLSIQEYRAVDGAFVRQVANLPGPVGVLDVSPDGTLIASGSFIFEGLPSGDPHIRIWRTSDLSPVAVLDGGATDIMDVDFSPDGSRLLSYDNSGVLRLWRTSDWSLENQLATPEYGVRSRFLGDGHTAVSINFFGQLTVFSIPGMSVLQQGSAGVSSFLGAFAVSPDGHRALAESFNGLSWIDLDTLTTTCTTSQIMQGYDADWSPATGIALLTGLPFSSNQHALELWATPTKTKVAGFVFPNQNQAGEALGIRHRPGFPRQFAVGFGTFSVAPNTLALGICPKTPVMKEPGIKK